MHNSIPPGSSTRSRKGGRREAHQVPRRRARRLGGGAGLPRTPRRLSGDTHSNMQDVRVGAKKGVSTQCRDESHAHFPPHGAYPATVRLQRGGRGHKGRRRGEASRPDLGVEGHGGRNREGLGGVRVHDGLEHRVHHVDRAVGLRLPVARAAPPQPPPRTNLQTKHYFFHRVYNTASVHIRKSK